MARPEGNTSEKSPLLALEPVVVFDVVGVGEERVEAEEGEGVDVRPGVERAAQLGACDLARDDVHGDHDRVDWLLDSQC